MNFSLFCFPPPLGADYFLRTSFSVTIEAFLLRIRDVLWDGLKSELSNWTYRAKVPDYLAVRFTNNGGYSHNLSPKREREREREREGGGGRKGGALEEFFGASTTWFSWGMERGSVVANRAKMGTESKWLPFNEGESLEYHRALLGCFQHSRTGLADEVDCPLRNLLG